jgi:hypothetical protein
VTAAALVFSACGGSKGSDSGGKVTATAFAHSVCSAVVQWQADIQKRSSDVSTQLGTSPDAAKGKQVLADFIDGIITDTDTVIPS